MSPLCACCPCPRLGFVPFDDDDNGDADSDGGSPLRSLSWVSPGSVPSDDRDDGLDDDYDDDDNADVDGGGGGDGVDHDAFDDHAHSSMAPRVRRKMRHESYTSTVPAQRRVILDQLKS